MIKYFSYILLLFVFISCSTGVMPYEAHKNGQYLKLDISKLKLDDKNEYVEQKGDSLIVTSFNEKENIYHQKITIYNSPYQIDRAFYKDSGTLYGESCYFYELFTGISRTYDKQGNVTVWIDWDNLSSFTAQKLIRKIRRKYGIDVLHPVNLTTGVRNMKIGRGADKDIENYYLFSYCVNMRDGSEGFQLVRIDANTGEIIDERHYAAGERSR